MSKNLAKIGFTDGLVFGFDVGTGSIGYAARRGSTFLDVGVLICSSEASDLSKRRELRRQRRTLRSRKHRRQWFAGELVKLGLPKPEAGQNDPLGLRLRAIAGEALQPGELHAALTHLFKRRGYSKVPWANEERAAMAGAGDKAKDDEGIIKAAVAATSQKLEGRHPCQFLAEERRRVGKSPTAHWARKIYWPREALQKEFEAILEAQQHNFPRLTAKKDWLLYGETKAVGNHHVFFRNTEGRNPGVLGLRWPRFDNRSPALDSLNPVDHLGQPLHVVRKNKEAFTRAQWELALMNFRVLDASTRQKIDPRARFPEFVENLRHNWHAKGKVTLASLRKLARPFAGQFELLESQKGLTPETASGRARYCSPTLESIRETIAQGGRVDPPQPILQRPGENIEQALNRYLTNIKHPLVRHRLVLFRRLLARLVASHGQPDLVVVEAVRSLALGKKAKSELDRRNDKFREERDGARQQLSEWNQSISRKAIQRYRLWKEAGGRCPFCLQMIARADLGQNADIEHLVPRTIVDCNEFYNLTVAHIQCNRERKGNRTPFDAFGSTPDWPGIQQNAEKSFTGRKLEIFLSPNAETLIEQKTDLQHTAYLARVIRQLSLIQLGWLDGVGRDPTPQLQNPAMNFQVTNGHLTSRLRKAWGLNQLLHPLPAGMNWQDLPEADREQRAKKNRGDLRHHALDAMVIACTLPWLAHRTHGATDELGRHGWWTQDEKQRSAAANPVFPQAGQMHRVVQTEIEKLVVRHHASNSNHQRAYATTLYSKKGPDTYVARDVFITLKPKDLHDIWPKAFSDYCITAWQHYTAGATDVDAELKMTKGCVPQAFVSKLCFSHFQKWRQGGGKDFAWPEAVKIPIRSVRLISVKDDTAVAPFSQGTRAYVKRAGFKEVRVFLSADATEFVPVFVPYWRGDKPFAAKPYEEKAKPVATFRRGMVLAIKKPFSAGYPPGKYRVLRTGQVQLLLLPHHVADDPEAISAFGLGKTGPQPRWPDLMRALGYELPHPPPVESRA